MPPNAPWTDAVLTVLRASAEPMHYAAIAQAIVDQGLRTDVGATPAASVASILSESITREGDRSPFYRASRGMYGHRREGGSGDADPMAARPEPDPAEEDAEVTGLINAFGILWSRSDVSWSGTTTMLYGRNTPASKSVDFGAQQGVYLLYDVARVIYVGQVSAQRLGARLAEHTVDRLQSRWGRFSWFGVRPVTENGELSPAAERVGLSKLIDTMETLLIEGLEPPLNRRAGSGFSGTEFLQAVDPDRKKRDKQRLLDELSRSL